MFENHKFWKATNLANNIYYYVGGDNGDEDRETRPSSESILQPKSLIKEVHVAKIETFWKLLLAMGAPTKTKAFGFHSIVQQ